MRDDLLGLPLDLARDILAREGVSPSVETTCAPGMRDARGGTLRVVAAHEDGRRLTVAEFLDPIEDGGQENG